MQPANSAADPENTLNWQRRTLMALKTHGTMAVDWENRIDFDRLRRERLQKAKDLLAKSSMGSLLCFDMNNVRYLTATHIGTWAQDKANRFTLLPQNDEPILWDFGSAAKHHQLNCPWLGERSRPGISMLRGAMTPKMSLRKSVSSSNNAACTKSRWASTLSNCPCCLPCSAKESKSSTASNSC